MTNDLSLLTVSDEQGSLQFTCRFYEDPPQQNGGGGGWVPVQRPQNSAFTAWQGPTDGFHLVLNLVMDQWTSTKGADVEHACRTLDKMYGSVTNPMTRPPALILDAKGALQYDVTNYPRGRWVIGADPQFGSTAGDVLRNDKGQRVRQVVTVDFMLFVPYDETSRTATNSQSTPAGTFIASAQINTFKKAAAKYLKSYGGATLGNRLAQFNNKRDGTAPLQPGTGPYRLPSGATAKSWSNTPRR